MVLKKVQNDFWGRVLAMKGISMQMELRKQRF